MNKMIKTTVIATAIFVTTPLFANTTASSQVNGSVELSTENQGLLKSLNQGVTNTAQKVGNGIEQGVDKTRNVTQNTWEASKEASHRVGNGVQHTAQNVGNGIEKGVDHSKNYSQEKWEDTKQFTSNQTEAVKEKTKKVKDKTSENSNKVKQTTQNTWNKTKNVLTPNSKEAHLKSELNTEIHTPIGSTRTNVNSSGSIQAQ